MMSGQREREGNGMLKLFQLNCYKYQSHALVGCIRIDLTIFC